jgi:hypothetical protein
MQKKVSLTYIFSITVIIIILIFTVIPSPVLAAAGDETTPGTISLIATIECIGAVVTYSGDNDNNSSCVLEYSTDSANWLTAPPVQIDRADKQFKGSCFWCTEKTLYYVRATFSDVDGISGSNPLIATVTTLDPNPPLGTVHTYHVSKTGNDTTGDGSAGKPWLTIQKAANTVVAGDTVYVHGGTYDEMVTITADGTSSNWITFMPNPGDTVIVNGTIGSKANNFYLNSANYVRIKGFNCTNSYNDSGILVLSSSHNIIEDNVITGPGLTATDSLDGGIDIKSSTYCICQDNTITITTCTLSWIEGIVVEGARNSGNVIRRNIIGGDFYYLRDGISFSPEDAYGNSENDIYDNYIEDCYDDDIQLDGNGRNVRCWGNICNTNPDLTAKDCGWSYASLSSLSTQSQSDGPCYIFRNQCSRRVKMGGISGGTYFYHNTFWSSPFLVLLNSGSTIHDVVTRNNLVLNSHYNYVLYQDGPVDNCDFDYDDLSFSKTLNYFARWMSVPTYSTFAAFVSGTGDETHGMSNSDHKFTNAGAGDYTLQSDSPDIDKGVVLIGFNDANSPWSYTGSAPDIGAYEYGRSYTRPVKPPSQGGSGTNGGSTGGGGYIGGGDTGVSGGGDGGGGGGGITSLRYSISTDCRMMEDIAANELNMNVTLNIFKDTIVKNKNNQPPTSIRIKPLTESLPVSTGMQLIGQQYEIGQSGISFDPSATLVFKYTNSELPVDVPAVNLFIALWDPDIKLWQDVGGTVDTSNRCVSTNITHLSTYALMAHTLPAEITISGITLSAREVLPGKPVTASIIVNNNGDLSGNYTAVLKIDNIAVQTKDITISGGDSGTIDFEIVQYSVGEHRIGVGEILTTLVVKKLLSPTIFIVGELSVNPLSSEVGENLIISVPVQNGGDLSGTFQASLTVDDNVIETKSIILDGASSITLEFNYTSDTVGTHTASIGDQAVTFEVKDEELPNQTQTVDNNVRLEIDSSSITPNFNPSTKKLVYTVIVCKIDQPWETTTGYNILLSVSHDDNLVEQVPLMTSSQLKEDGQTGEFKYVPDTGWKNGQYTFRMELYHGDNLVQTAEFLPLIVESESSSISWMNLGAIIGCVFLAGVIALVVVLYFKRKNFNYYWK